MNTYKKMYLKWTSDLGPIEKVVLEQLTMKQESQVARLRDHPKEERRLTRLANLILEGKPSPEEWQSIFEVIVNLPEDDLCFCIDGLVAKDRSNEEVAELVSYATTETQQKLHESIKHFSTVNAMRKTWSQENITVVGQAAARLDAKSK